MIRLEESMMEPFQGQRIFHCISSSKTPASFVRATRKPDPTRTVLDAVRFKYGHLASTNGHIPTTKEVIEISGKTVEEVGFEKIEMQMANLAELRIVLVDGLQVAGLLTGDDPLPVAQEELASTCPNITELDVGWNLLETWQDIADICPPLKKLRTLKASGLRLRDSEAEMLPVGTSPFQTITELQLNECLVKVEQISKLLSHANQPLFPNLKSLWLSENELSGLKNLDNTMKYPSVISIVLENNLFDSLQPLLSLCAVFPNLTTLSLQGNKVSVTGVNAKISEKLVSLNLAENQIESFSFVDALPSLFPNLASLRISKNPLYDLSVNDASQPQTTSNAISTSYYLTLARIPTLKTLNHSTITDLDRQEGEIYYLSITEKKILAKQASTTPEDRIPLLAKLTLYSTLCEKYDRHNILLDPDPTPSKTTTSPQHLITNDDKYPPNSLGRRLIHATFYFSSPSSSSTTPNPQHLSLRLPPSTSVYTLSALLARHFSLPYLSFRLIYESPELDPLEGVEATTRKTNTSTLKNGDQEAQWDGWGDWDCDVPPPIGDASMLPGAEVGLAEHKDEGRWDGDILLKDGVRWKKREVEIQESTRGWGDFLDGERVVKVRIEFKERR